MNLQAVRPLHVCVLAGAVLATSPLAAQPRSNSSTNDDEAQHNQGNRLREQGRHADARDLFRSLYERTHEPRALVRQALAEMALQEWIAADEHITTAIATQGNRWIDENRSRIEAAQREIQTHVGSLVIECTPAGASVTVNTTRATCPLARPMRLPVGAVSVRVEAPGSLPMIQTAEVVAGAEPTVLRMFLANAPPVVDPSVRERALASNRRRGLMLGLGGASLGLGAVGLGLGVAGLLITDDRGDINTPLAVAGFTAGGVFAITGVVLMVAAPARQDTSSMAAMCSPTLQRPGFACALRF